MTGGLVWKRVHLVMGAGWAVMIPVSLLTGLKSSVPFLVGISLWALVVGEFSAYQGARAEVKVDEANVTAERANVTAGDVVVE